MRTPNRRGRAHLGVVGAVALCALALVGCSAGSNSVDQAAGGSFGFVKQAAGQDFVPVASRKTAPTLTGSTVTGGQLSLASLRGRVVVVNFWASWCSPCRGETPGLVSLAKSDPRVAFVGVNEKDQLSSARAFVRDFRVPYPSIVDRIGAVAASWPMAPGLPSTFVLDPNGRIAARFTGSAQTTDLTPVLAKLQAEKA